MNLMGISRFFSFLFFKLKAMENEPSKWVTILSMSCLPFPLQTDGLFG